MTPTKAEPTPGPWRLIEAHVEEDGSVYPPHIVGGARELQICSFFEFGDDRICESETDVRSERANAALIASAPRMMDALENIAASALRNNGPYARDNIAHALKTIGLLAENIIQQVAALADANPAGKGEG